MRRVLTAGAVLAAVAAVPPAPPASAAAPYKGANTATVQDDFNGDGYRDVVIGAPDAKYGSVTKAGAVVVLYGSASGVSTAHRQVITQATTGIPGTPGKNDRFGQTVTTADLDRDGYADLVVGTPRKYFGLQQGLRGSVTVIWGGPGGLKGGADIAPPAGYGQGSSYCLFGQSLATGDMNGDGAPELAVGSTCQSATYTGPFTRSGKPASQYLGQRLKRSVVMGDVDGDGKAELFSLPGPVLADSGPLSVVQDDPAATPASLPLAHGWYGQVGDVNGDGYGDLVTGVPSGGHTGGEIQVLYGSAHGIAAGQQPVAIHQDTPGVPGVGKDGGQFGSSLSIGDVDGDKYADVFVGVPYKTVGSAKWAGEAVLLRGSATGLTGAKATGYTQNTAGVPGTAESEDYFGWAVHLADVDKDGKADALVGAPGENTDGLVWAARGSAGGPVTNGSVAISGQSAGITPGSAALSFGAALPSTSVTR
ncbi:MULTISPECIES: FG-GAP-like repeat-containing protein [Streptomyces]|uniref:FG-GAP-like repeat-containing protein n=1 Tax=Streptomyces TaxID=1883 RepID=UPI0004CD9565|nr:FG-GAP-like repeat-containing protein [Streptomyces durhamensis]